MGRIATRLRNRGGGRTGDLTRPLFSVIVPTCGRQSLRRTLRRLRAEDRGDIEVVVVGDGPQPGAEEITRGESARWPSLRYLETEPTGSWGNAQRMAGIEQAKGRYLVFMDDDDLTKRGAFGAIREAVRSTPDRVLLFRMRYLDGRVLWRDQVVELGNVSTQQVVVPNQPGKVGSWLTEDRYTSDFDFITECVQLQGEPVWRPEVVALIGALPLPAHVRWWVRHTGSRVVGKARRTVGERTRARTNRS